VHWWFVTDSLVLFLCTSMYLGTGWSLILFSFPTAKDLRPDNYYDQFVPQVEAATRFFTVMTTVMLAAGVVMIVWDPRHFYWALPSVVVAGVVVATVLTVLWIFPDNKRMAAHITTQAELDTVLRRWMRKNVVRVGLWSVQWSAMAAWFGLAVSR